MTWIVAVNIYKDAVKVPMALKYNISTSFFFLWVFRSWSTKILFLKMLMTVIVNLRNLMFCLSCSQ